MFDTTNYDKSVTADQVRIIDNFFESLAYNNKLNPTVPMINYGELIMMVDTNNRWVYKGSVTTPPCAKTVYWNVVRTVYPIKQKHLDYYINYQLVRNKLQNIKKTGNNRRVQPETEAHSVRILSTYKMETATNYKSWTIVLAIISAVLLVGIIICYYLKSQL